MARDALALVTDAANELGFSPKKLARRFVERWFKGEQFEAAIQEWLLEGPAYLYELVAEQSHNIKAAGVGPVEAMVIAEQVIDAQSRASSMAKKELLAHVAVNGMVRADVDAERRRAHWRAVHYLDPEHVDFLRKVSLLAPRRGPTPEIDCDDLTPGWVAELERLGLVAMYDSSTGRVTKTALLKDIAPLAQHKRWIGMTSLGTDFLEFTRRPELPPD